MPHLTERFNWVAKLARFTLVGSIAFMGLLVVTTIFVLLVKSVDSEQVTSLSHIIPASITHIDVLLIILAEALLIAVLFVTNGLIRVMLAKSNSLAEINNRLDHVELLLGDSLATQKSILDLSSLSNKAKSLIYSEREIEAFRERIHDHIMRQDYKSAELMANQIRDEFGYIEESDRLKAEIEQTRRSTLDEKIDGAIQRIQSIIDICDWARALREAQRMMTVFPDNDKIAALPDRISTARSQHKRKLLQLYGEAVRKNDVDQGVALLKELDAYLSPQEAAALEESARGVFRERLHQMGVQFAIKVNDQQWTQAVETAEEIVREFPNSRMAHEVRQKLDALKTRATENDDSSNTLG